MVSWIPLLQTVFFVGVLDDAMRLPSHGMPKTPDLCTFRQPNISTRWLRMAEKSY